MAFVPEPRIVRLATLIAACRRVGRWKDANNYETELAALEGRSAIHVPAPDWEAPKAAQRPNPPPATDIEWDMVPE